MPALSDHPSTSLVKILIAADSGTGKTGALASLIDAGYNIRVLDFDEGVSTIRGYVKNKALLATNVAYIPLRDRLELMGDKMGIKKAVGFQRAMEALESKPQHWGVEPPLPPIRQWTEKDVLVVDTLTMMGRSCMYHVMAMNGALAKNPEIQHYGVAMENLEKFIGQITSEDIPCNVVVNTHMMTVEGSTKIYPDALGSKLGPKVGRYFDNMITLSSSGGKKIFRTKQDGAFACKTAIPIDDTYPLETGLAQIFERLKKG